MSEALSLAVNVFLRQGLWVAAAGWLLAVGGWALFVHHSGSAGSDEDSADLLKRKAILGAVVLAAGIVLAL